MTITPHGLSCDVCNEYILLEASGNPFRIFGVEGLHAHEKCKRQIIALDTKAPLFWRTLPEGRVRQLAEDIHERDCGPECRYCPIPGVEDAIPATEPSEDDRDEYAREDAAETHGGWR